MAIASSAQGFTTVYDFCSQSNCADGVHPNASLVQATDGNFYGTTTGGGANSSGTVFKLSPTGMLSTLYSFCSQSNCTDGALPSSALVQATDGNLYGTTASGGANQLCDASGCGTIFRITPNGALTTIYNFCSQTGCTDGSAPNSLVQGTDGNFYGTTAAGGDNHCENAAGCGTAFKLTTTGTLTTLHILCSQNNCADGATPNGIIEASDGNFYGTTLMGGNSNCIYGCGTVFQLTPTGTLTTLYSFCSQPNCSDGEQPAGGLVQAMDGNLYGTTQYGGADNGSDAGTVFRIPLAGALTTIYRFCSQFPCSGVVPQGSLIQANDGNLYGITNLGGGPNDGGTIFKLTPAGTLTTLYNFCSQPECTDGYNPTAGLLQATDGTFYGTTDNGGTNGGPLGDGTIYRLNLALAPFVIPQPSSGGPGTPVTIYGSNLTGTTRVTFNSMSATFNVVSPTQITTSVPTGATTGAVTVYTPSGIANSVMDFQVTGPLQFVKVMPCRLVDTRQTGGPIQGGTTRSFIPSILGGCGIPPIGVAAYSLNVTVVPPGPLGYLTIWPLGEIQPFVSTMNSPDGRTKANAAIVPSGGDAINVYVTDTTDVILDIDGYFAPSGEPPLQFYPLPPCRVVDTRGANGDLGGPYLMAQMERDFPVLESQCLSNVNGAQAYSMNFTVVPHTPGQPLGYLTVWPKGETQPVVSTLNNPTATVVANAAIVPAGTSGAIATYAYNDTDLIVDINGYFAAPSSSGYSFYPVTPCRAYDSRNNNGQPFTGERTVNIAGSFCAPPGNAAAYVFNATVVPQGMLGFLTLWADEQTMPGVSTLNAYDGFITSNMAIVPNSNGSTDAYAGDGYTQLILDIAGYFAP